MDKQSNGGIIPVIKVFATLIAGIVFFFSAILATAGSQSGTKAALISALIILVCNWKGILKKISGEAKSSEPDNVAVVPAPDPIVPAAIPQKPVGETKAYRVKGTTFKNNDGSDRQTILRRIKFRDPPFDAEMFASIKEYEYEGEPAIGVYVNDTQVGNVAKTEVPYIVENWDKIEGVTAFEVTGGGNGRETGERLNYGAIIYIRFILE